MFFSSHLKVAMDQSSWSRQAGRRAGAHFRVAQQAVSTFKSIFTQRRGKTNERKRKTPTDSKVKAPSGFAVLATAAVVVATTVVVSRLCIWCLHLCVCVLFVQGDKWQRRKEKEVSKLYTTEKSCWNLEINFSLPFFPPPPTNHQLQKTKGNRDTILFFPLFLSWQKLTTIAVKTVLIS